jgi:hypothetical protein
MIARSALVFPWLAPKIASTQLCRRFLKTSLLTVATQDQQRGRSGAMACSTRDNAPAKLAGTTRSAVIGRQNYNWEAKLNGRNWKPACG